MPGSVQAALTEVSARLRAAGIVDPGRDARLLVAAALGVAPDRVTLSLQDALTGPVRERLDRYLLAAGSFRQPWGATLTLPTMR